MHSTQRIMPWFLFLAWFVPGLALAQAEGTLIGKVVDPDGHPLQGVMVTATSPQVPSFKDVETTDWKGTFAVKLPKIDVTYHYRFDMPGYESMEADQQWHMVGSQFFQWTMHPAAPQLAGALPAASTSEEAILAYNAGITAVKAKDNATAEAKFKEALKHDSKLRQGWEQLSTVELQLGHNQEAADAAEKAIALGSTDQATLVTRWQAYHNLKDDAKTAEALKDVERIGRHRRSEEGPQRGRRPPRRQRQRGRGGQVSRGPQHRPDPPAGADRPRRGGPRRPQCGRGHGGGEHPQDGPDQRAGDQDPVQRVPAPSRQGAAGARPWWVSPPSSPPSRPTASGDRRYDAYDANDMALAKDRGSLSCCRSTRTSRRPTTGWA